MAAVTRIVRTRLRDRDFVLLDAPVRLVDKQTGGIAISYGDDPQVQAMTPVGDLPE